MTLGLKFTTLNSRKDYKIIEKHKMFEDVWRCYPAEKEGPYKQNLIECFSTDFINECLKQEIHENSSILR